MYQYGSKMFEDLIEKGDKSKIADLEKNLRLRMQHFPSKTKEGREMANIAQIKYEAGIGTNRYSASIFFTELSNRFKLPHFLPFYGELHCCKHFLRKSSFFYNTVIKVKVQVNSTSPICSKFYY